MNTRLPVSRTLFVVAAMLACTSSARAQATRTWISGVGDDANPCSRTAPCKTFAGAISKTARGGEISVLDPGGFGAVTITKSITLDGTGTLASLLVTAGSDGIIINITDPSDSASVRIRGLALNGASTGGRGIRVVAAKEVTIEQTIVDGFQNGIVMTGPGKVFIQNSTIRNNNRGVSSTVTGGIVVLSNVSVVMNGIGIGGVGGGQVISFQNNAIYGNTTDGDPTSTLTLR